MNETTQSLPLEPGVDLELLGSGLPQVGMTDEIAPSAQVAMAQREVEAQVVLAKRFPRSESDSYQRIIRACKRPTFAAVAEYRYPRGGKNIMGPSVYFAREAAKLWGNIRFGFSVIVDTPDSRTVRGFAWDLETNSYNSLEDTFQKLQQRKNKDTGETAWVVPDERDLRELTNKRGAILVRNCVLQIIPEDVKADALKIAAATRRDEDAKDPDAARKEIVSGFDKLNIPASELEEFIGHALAQAGPAELTELREIYASVRDGNTRWHEHLNQRRQERSAEPESGPGDESIPGARPKGKR